MPLTHANTRDDTLAASRASFHHRFSSSFHLFLLRLLPPVPLSYVRSSVVWLRHQHRAMTKDVLQEEKTHEGEVAPARVARVARAPGT